MKALLYSQINPSKTIRQFIDDRNLYRLLLLGAMLLAWCK